MKKEAIKIFEEKKVRTIWDEELEKWLIFQRLPYCWKYGWARYGRYIEF